MYCLTLEGMSDRLDLPADRTILDACLDQGAPLPYNCRSGECGECAAQLVAGRIQELPGADPAIFTPAMREAGMILTCMCYPASDLQLRVPLRSGDAPPIRTFDGVVSGVTWFGERSVRVTLRVDEDVSYQAGQYFEWHLPGLEAPRSYSVANPPGSRTLEFLVRLHENGGVSQRLQRSELAAGDVVTLKGPFGSYALDAQDDRMLILVAGGTGLAPVKCIVEDLVARGSRRPVKVFFGARDQEELGYASPLQALAQRTSNVEFIAALSHEPTDSSWSGRRGLVVDALREMSGDAFGAQAYLCGPPPMFAAATTLLDRMGVAREDIHCDKFSPAGSRSA